MPLLACKDYSRPILQALQANPSGLAGSTLSEQVARATDLSAADRGETISDGTPKYLVRIKQARYHLKTSGLVASLPNGTWVITKTGQEHLNSGVVSSKPPKPIARIHKAPKSQSKAHAAGILPLNHDDPVEAPIERVDQALREIQDEVAHELLQILSERSPAFFERTVLKLLKAMGYGDHEHTGGPGDGGIDGILYSDRLGLERVYVQAKRWNLNGTVGSPEIRSFCGALTINHAGKGVFITTATFTADAEKEAKKVPQVIRLVDGKKVAELMIEFGVGVSKTHVRTIPEVDRNFFDEA